MKPVDDIACAHRFCAVSRWLPANKAVFFHYNDPGLHRIP